MSFCDLGGHDPASFSVSKKLLVAWHGPGHFTNVCNSGGIDTRDHCFLGKNHHSGYKKGWCSDFNRRKEKSFLKLLSGRGEIKCLGSFLS